MWVRTYGFGPDGYYATILGRELDYEFWYGLALNQGRAHALEGHATMRAIRAALSRHPDPLLLDAASECEGLDLRQRLSEGKLDALEDEADRQLRQMFGGNGRGTT